MKNLNFDSYTNETKVMVTRATLTMLDRRSGEIFEKTIFRPGTQFPETVVAREMANYGYDVIGYKDVDCAEGVIDWSMLFETLQAETA